MFGFLKRIFCSEPVEDNLSLEPCPFCGSRKCYAKHERVGMDSYVSASHEECNVVCDNCKGNGPLLTNNEADAEDLWDTRPKRVVIQLTRRYLANSCPFCEQPKTIDDHFVSLQGREGNYYVWCSDCMSGAKSGKTKEEAILNWNGDKEYQ